jgi:phosphatidate cytidylyltransferase
LSRLVSAVVLIAIVLGVLLWLPAWMTAVAAAIIASIAACELAGMAAKAGAPIPAAVVALAAAAMVLAFVLHEQRGPDSRDLFGAILLGLVVVAGATTLGLGPPNAGTLTRAATLVMVPMYVGLPLGAIAWVQWAAGPAATLWLVGTIVVSDSAQYYTGRALGRRKLAASVSPAKTVEGALGGLAAAALAGGIAGPRILEGLSPGLGAAIGLLLAVAGIAGDLFESLLKRGVGVKDSSALIPGHGGVLDRIDAQLFAAPVFYLLLRYVA